jgi:fatty-acyl-CoA synthase
MTDWNLADIWEVVAGVAGERPAQICGTRRFTWSEFDRRADGLACDLLQAGLSHQSKVAAYLHNGPEYLETYFAAFKAGMVPVNVNYRYGPSELAYLLDNADAEAVVFGAGFAPVLDEVRPKLDGVKRWYAVGSPRPDWAIPYERVAGSRRQPAVAPWARSGDDLLLLYTGGTTGMPKGVMWRQDDLVNVLGGGGNPLVGLAPASGLDELRERVSSAQAAMRSLPACPLMHGTGQFSAFIALILGGCIVTLPDPHFDPRRLLETVVREQVNSVSIVGDAFARPLLAELDSNPGKYDLSHLTLINSSGVIWSQEVKDGLLRHAPHLILFDSLGSSEAVGMGASVSGGATTAATAEFALGEGARVITPEDRDVAPGSGEVGMIALPGFLPVGYYKDPVKSQATFRTIDGTRYTVPGDCAVVDAGGAIRLLGRGSVVINTGGEKVYPEEVEEVIKRLPQVADAVCVGIPDERFGERVCALVEPVPGASIVASSVSEAVKAELAGYKVPRTVELVDTIARSPAGKVDYPRLRQMAIAMSSAAG